MGQVDFEITLIPDLINSFFWVFRYDKKQNFINLT